MESSLPRIQDNSLRSHRLACLVFLAFTFATARAEEPAKATLLRVSDKGLQPQVAVDGKGVVHLLAETGSGVLAAWETDGQVYYARIDPANGKRSEPVAAPGVGKGRKHPVVAGNAQGETILVWTEGVGWNRDRSAGGHRRHRLRG